MSGTYPYVCEAEFDNLLVAQKNAIIVIIDRGDINEALCALNILHPLWKTCNYEYKYLELVNRAHRVSAQFE